MHVPDSVGVMILRSAVLFPQALLPLHIFEERYRRMLADSLASHRLFCVAIQKSAGNRETPMTVAGLGFIRAAVSRPDGTSNIILQGIARVGLVRVLRYKPYRLYRIRILDPGKADTVAVDALRTRVLELTESRIRDKQEVESDLLRQLARSGGDAEDPTRSAINALRSIPDAGQFADLIAMLTLPGHLHRQLILQCADIHHRLRTLITFLSFSTPAGPPETPGDTPF